MIKINLSNILKIDKHKYFDKVQKNYETINNKLHNRLLIMMICAYLNNSNEVLLLMNNSSYRYKTAKGNNDSVKLTARMYTWMNNSKSTFTAFHNHPNDSTFSLDDLEQLIINPKLQLVMLCTNSCKYCAALYKSKGLSSIEVKAIIYMIQKYKLKFNVDGHADATPLITKLSNQGIIYAYYMNRRI